mmetsp:Transcript_46150/g.142229  ORF Transcript_46150/g.142229 Transcript_46150/m.142229 type:complete len:634 (-) Transcript_46150:402-2303(-)
MDPRAHRARVQDRFWLRRAARGPAAAAPRALPRWRRQRPQHVPRRHPVRLQLRRDPRQLLVRVRPRAVGPLPRPLERLHRLRAADDDRLEDRRGSPDDARRVHHHRRRHDDGRRAGDAEAARGAGNDRRAGGHHPPAGHDHGGARRHDGAWHAYRHCADHDGSPGQRRAHAWRRGPYDAAAVNHREAQRHGQHHDYRGSAAAEEPHAVANRHPAGAVVRCRGGRNRRRRRRSSGQPARRHGRWDRRRPRGCRGRQRRARHARGDGARRGQLPDVAKDQGRRQTRLEHQSCRPVAIRREPRRRCRRNHCHGRRRLRAASPRRRRREALGPPRHVVAQLRACQVPVDLPRRLRCPPARAVPRGRLVLGRRKHSRDACRRRGLARHRRRRRRPHVARGRPARAHGRRAGAVREAEGALPPHHRPRAPLRVLAPGRRRRRPRRRADVRQPRLAVPRRVWPHRHRHPGAQARVHRRLRRHRRDVAPVRGQLRRRHPDSPRLGGLHPRQAPAPQRDGELPDRRDGRLHYDDRRVALARRAGVGYQDGHGRRRHRLLRRGRHRRADVALRIPKVETRGARIRRQGRRRALEGRRIEGRQPRRGAAARHPAARGPRWDRQPDLPRRRAPIDRRQRRLRHDA